MLKAGAAGIDMLLSDSLEQIIADLLREEDPHSAPWADRAAAQIVSALRDGSPILKDAERYWALAGFLRIERSDPNSWTCWLALDQVPFRFDPSRDDPAALLDAMVERFKQARR